MSSLTAYLYSGKMQQNIVTYKSVNIAVENYIMNNYYEIMLLYRLGLNKMEILSPKTYPQISLTITKIPAIIYTLTPVPKHRCPSDGGILFLQTA